jgi:hypothetical protein
VDFGLRCFGPTFTAASTAFSNRFQPSGRNSILSVSGGFMTPDFRVFVESKDFTEWASLVGQIVIAWGAAEASINLLVNIFHVTHGDKASEIKPPFRLSERIRVLKIASRDSSLPAELKADLRCALIDAARLAKVRDMLVHGYTAHYDRQSGILTYARFDPMLGGHVAKEAPYSLPVLHSVANETFKLARRLSEALVSIHDDIEAHNSAD